VVLNTHSGIVNGVGMLVVDVVLLLTMLIGLLRRSDENPTGIWKLLYQQVSLEASSQAYARC
jgi:hypothetical protein